MASESSTPTQEALEAALIVVQLQPEFRHVSEVAYLIDESIKLPALLEALGESVKLQSHYAALLNMHDGGTRIGFASGDDWIKRLKEVGKLK